MRHLSGPVKFWTGMKAFAPKGVNLYPSCLSVSKMRPAARFAVIKRVGQHVNYDMTTHIFLLSRVR